MMAESTLANVSMKDIMVEDVKYLKETDTIGDAVEAFSKYRVGGFPVVDDSNRLVAYLSDGDIIHYILYRAGAQGLVFFKHWSDMDVDALAKAPATCAQQKQTKTCAKSLSTWIAKSSKTCQSCATACSSA